MTINFDKPENNIALTITPKKRRYRHEKGRIHIYEMESYKHASEEQRNSMRICKIRYFDLEGLPSKEVKEILEAFIWERGRL